MAAEWIRPSGVMPCKGLIASVQASPAPPPRKTFSRVPSEESFELIPSDRPDLLAMSGHQPRGSVPQQARREACSVVLYFHGGAYITGGINSHRRLMSQLAVAAGVPVLGKNSSPPLFTCSLLTPFLCFLGIEFRVMPQHTFDDVLQDAVEAFHHLTDVLRYPAGEIAVAGDSSGGHLALSLALYLHETQQEVCPSLLGRCLLFASPGLSSIRSFDPIHHRFEILSSSNTSRRWIFLFSR